MCVCVSVCLCYVVIVIFSLHILHMPLLVLLEGSCTEHCEFLCVHLHNCAFSRVGMKACESAHASTLV